MFTTRTRAERKSDPAGVLLEFMLQAQKPELDTEAAAKLADFVSAVGHESNNESDFDNQEIFDMISNTEHVLERLKELHPLCALPTKEEIASFEKKPRLLLKFPDGHSPMELAIPRTTISLAHWLETTADDSFLCPRMATSLPP